MVMVSGGSLDLFWLMVDVVTGSVFLSIIIWLIIMFIMGAMSRLSMQSMLIIMGFFLVTMLIGYFGSLVAILAFIAIGYYMIGGILSFINSVR